MKKLLLVGLVGFSFIMVVMYVRVTTQSQPTPSPSSPAVQDVSTPSQRQSSDATAPRYVPYSASTFDTAKDKKRILYFHADWCSVCKPLDKELSEKSDQIPPDVVVLKANYDRETELKKKYAITYQHTFVFVDDEGGEIDRWGGGGLTDIIKRFQ